jgi:hypothetical protein
MRFVATKTPEQQSCVMLHRTCHLFIRQQTAVINAIRAHLAELGIVPSDAKASRVCTESPPIQKTNECLKSPAHVSPRSAQLRMLKILGILQCSGHPSITEQGLAGLPPSSSHGAHHITSGRERIAPPIFRNLSVRYTQARTLIHGCCALLKLVVPK